MTATQTKIFKSLKGGSYLVSDITGWRRASGTKLSEATREALESTRELVEVVVDGFHVKHMRFIAHVSQFNALCSGWRARGKKIVDTRPIGFTHDELAYNADVTPVEDRHADNPSWNM